MLMWRGWPETLSREGKCSMWVHMQQASGLGGGAQIGYILIAPICSVGKQVISRGREGEGTEGLRKMKKA